MSVIGEVLVVVTALAAICLIDAIRIYTGGFRWRSTWGRWIVLLLSWWVVHEVIIALDVTVLPRQVTGPLLAAWEIGSLFFAFSLRRWLVRQTRQQRPDHPVRPEEGL